MYTRIHMEDAALLPLQGVARRRRNSRSSNMIARATRRSGLRMFVTSTSTSAASGPGPGPGPGSGSGSGSASGPVITTDQKKRCIVISPPDSHEHSATIIGPIHGLGDSASSWLDEALKIWYRVPHCKLVLPDAPVAPVTLNGGWRMPSWYDIIGLEDRFREECQGIDQSRKHIDKLIRKEISCGIPAQRIVLAGFSQGGALALSSGLQFQQEEIGGILVMSGYLAGAPSFRLAEIQKNVKVLHLHGEDDSMVLVDWAKRTQSMMTEFGMSAYTLKTYSGLEHCISEEEIQDGAGFLKSVLPPLS